MLNYKVYAKRIDGTKVEEIISAESEIEANLIASEKGLFVTKLVINSDKTKKKKKHMKVKLLVLFSKQMATMLTAGITTDKALNIIRSKAETEKTRREYNNLYEEVQKGSSISTALSKTEAFPELFINMVKTGESSGNLEEALQTMSKYYEQRADTDRKIKTAMLYPIILAIVTLLVTLILVTFVLPKIMDNFGDQELPWITKMVMGVSNFIVNKWYIIIAVVGLLIYGGVLAWRDDKIRTSIDKKLLTLPIVGKIVRVIYSARVASTVSSLYKVGANTLIIVEETRDVIGNKYIASLFDEVYIKVSTGALLSQSLEETDVFDPILYSMMEIGEEAGELGSVLDNISEYFDKESAAATTRLIGLLEPLMIIIMGIIVGVIMVAIMLPLVKLGQSF